MPRHFLQPGLHSVVRTGGMALAILACAAWSTDALAREPAAVASGQGVDATANAGTAPPVLPYGVGYEQRLRAARSKATGSTRLPADEASASREPGNPSANRGGVGGGRGGGRGGGQGSGGGRGR